jgi:hypothetical protein
VAAYELATKENIDPEAALLSAGYKRADVTRSKLQAVSKQKFRIKNALQKMERQEIRRGYYIKTKAKGNNDGSTSGISSVTDPTSEAINNELSLELESTHAFAAPSATSNFTTKASAALRTAATNTSSAQNATTINSTKALNAKTATSSATKGNARKEVKSRCSIRDKSLASNSRCTPSQVLAFMVEKNESDKRQTIAYEWAVAEATKCK